MNSDRLFTEHRFSFLFTFLQHCLSIIPNHCKRSCLNSPDVASHTVCSQKPHGCGPTSPESRYWWDCTPAVSKTGSVSSFLSPRSALCCQDSALVVVRPRTPFACWLSAEALPSSQRPLTRLGWWPFLPPLLRQLNTRKAGA